MTRRPWLVPVAAALAAVGFLVAGVVTWRMLVVYPPARPCPANSLCYNPFPQFAYRVHPLRAELLWAASAALALVAVWAGVRLWRRPPGSATVGRA